MPTSTRTGTPLEYTQVEEQKRLNIAREQGVPWKKWGPYLSERQWGTVREDYSADGNAWDYFSHDQSRSRAYRWVKMVSPDSPTISSSSVLRWRCGMDAIPY